MTLEQTLFMLRELYELERADFVIRQDDEAPVWCRSVLSAIADRLKWSRYLLSVESPTVIAVAQDMLDAERLTTPSADPSLPALLLTGTVPGSARIH